MTLTYQELEALVKVIRYLPSVGKGNVEIETGLSIDDLYQKLYEEYLRYAQQKKAPAFNEFEGT